MTWLPPGSACWHWKEASRWEGGWGSIDLAATRQCLLALEGGVKVGGWLGEY